MNILFIFEKGSSGEFEHKDSAGGQGKMSPGDVQWMKTGRGIIHSEMPAMENGKLHGFQLWINMPSDLKKNKPEYLYIDSEKIPCYQDNLSGLLKITLMQCFLFR